MFFKFEYWISVVMWWLRDDYAQLLGVDLLVIVVSGREMQKEIGEIHQL